jgi:hypothetical protein
MPPGASLTLRRKADGKIYIAAPSGVPLSDEDADLALPAEHTLNARQIGRELEHEYGSMFEVLVRIKTENANALYELVGFEEKDPDTDIDDELNYNNWKLRRIEEDDTDG